MEPVAPPKAHDAEAVQGCQELAWSGERTGLPRVMVEGLRLKYMWFCDADMDAKNLYSVNCQSAFPLGAFLARSERAVLTSGFTPLPLTQCPYPFPVDSYMILTFHLP